jgi:integrase
MQERVEDYLQARRALGYALHIEGQQLQRFACFAEQQGHYGTLTCDLAVAWACRSGTNIGPARRLEVLRPFAKYCALFEPQTEVPPASLLGPAHRRITPYIYSEQELTELLEEAWHLNPTDGLRPATMHCLLGLLASTGLRVTEALLLHRTDVDLDRGILTVRETKFRKSRYVPLHPTTQMALAEYADLRNRHLPLVRDSTFFLFDNGHAVSSAQARYAFGQLRTRLSWDSISHDRQPRLYDLRHTFACRRLLAWYAEGVDVHWAIPHLATYLGHCKVSDTYWYLTGVPALLAVAAARFEQSEADHEYP